MSQAPLEHRLVSLFLSLFDEADELHRFARHALGESVVYGIDREASITAQAETLVRQVQSLGRLDDALFDALAKNRPQQEEIIEQVRREILAEPEPEAAAGDAGSGRGPATRGGLSSGAPPADGDISAERAAWRRGLSDMLSRVSLEPRVPDDAWLGAAAVLSSFDPLDLEPLSPATPSGDGAGEEPPDILERLAAVSDLLPTGRMSLRIGPRQGALARLVDDDRLAEALAANPEPDERLRRVWEKVVAGGFVPTGDLAGAELEAARDLAEWLAASSLRPFDLDEVTALADRQQRMEPMRRLLGQHFRDRVEQHQALHDHLRPDPDDGPRVLVLWGIGGVGKSALLGRVMLDLEEQRSPWVYLDFDHPQADPIRPRQMVELVLRQLQQLFTSANVSGDLLALESASGGDSLAFTADLGGASDVDGLLAALGRTLSEHFSPPSLAVVFDTFEHVQARGPHAVDTVRELIGRVCHHLPYARVVVSGRGDVPWGEAAGAPVERIYLDDLDPESADAVLAALRVESPELRRLIVERVGRSPLSLRLAADRVADHDPAATPLDELLGAVVQGERQGQFYTRLLYAITDEDVRRLAHPGLVVRRVTVDILREVLAEVCDVDPDDAEELFERLPLHVTLYEPDEATPGEGTALRHRQDLREKMLRLMGDDPAWRTRVRRIHQGAIGFYRRRDDAIARGEEIYHHLMLDHDPDEFESRWGPDLVGSLTRAWDEPLPERARAWLAPRLGRAEGEEAWRDADWEIAAEREARSRLDSGDAAGALEVLRRRPSRSPGSSLHRLEARALLALGRRDEAAEVLDRGLAGAVEAGALRECGQLHLLAAANAVEQERGEDAFRHLGRAVELAGQLDDPLARLRARQIGLDAAHRFRREAGVRTARGLLEAAVLDVDEATLREDPDLVREATERLAAEGPLSAPVLRKVATTFGNRSKQDVLRRDAFVLGDLLEKAQATDAGRRQLSDLAGRVGLSREGYRIADLADQSIRHNRLGDALAAVLDSAGHDAGLRADAAGLLRAKKGGVF